MEKYLFLLVMFSYGIIYAADKGSWTGYISDSDCGAKGNNADHAACAKKCIKNGALAVFVIGDKVYTLKNPEKVKNYIGDKVTITGTMTGDAIDVDKVSK